MIWESRGRRSAITDLRGGMGLRPYALTGPESQSSYSPEDKRSVSCPSSVK